MSEYIREKLNEDISTEEIFEAISRLKIGKSPGPYGLTAGFFKIFKKQLTLYLGQVMNENMQGKEIPASWNEAAITLIHKHGLDETDVRNCRPISLLNNDYKLYANILANRLKLFLSDYIQEDQVEFLPNRHLKDNIRTLINVIEYYDKSPGKQAGLIFVDAEKVFDNLNLEFLTALLEKMDFSNRFTDAIKGISKNQSSHLIINNEKSANFQLWKGTRQGCPLSPLIFILVMEVMLSNIQLNKEIKGLNLKQYTYKYHAYADDVMFIAEDPLKTLLIILDEVNKFGQLAGFYIN